MYVWGSGSAHLSPAFSRRRTGSHLSGKKLVSARDVAAAGRKLAKRTGVFVSGCVCFVHLAGIQVFACNGNDGGERASGVYKDGTVRNKSLGRFTHTCVNVLSAGQSNAAKDTSVSVLLVAASCREVHRLAPLHIFLCVCVCVDVCLRLRVSAHAFSVSGASTDLH